MEINSVSRVQLVRGLKNKYATKQRIKLEVMLCSEFREPVDSLVQLFKFELKLLLCESISSNLWSNIDCGDDLRDAQPLDEIPFGIMTRPSQTVCAAVGNTVSLYVLLPSTAGRYIATISAVPVEPLSEQSQRCLVLPLWSDVFELTEPFLSVVAAAGTAAATTATATTTTTGGDGGAKASNHSLAPSLLCCVRPVNTQGTSVLIQEEYGAFLGSHIYDSAVILTRYLATITPYTTTTSCTSTSSSSSSSSSSLSSHSCIVELGSGCGVVSLWLCKRLQSLMMMPANKAVSVIATDLPCMLPAIRHNASLNSLEVQPVHYLGSSVSDERCAFGDGSDGSDGVGVMMSPPTCVVAPRLLLSVQELDWTNKVSVSSLCSQIQSILSNHEDIEEGGVCTSGTNVTSGEDRESMDHGSRLLVVAADVLYDSQLAPVVLGVVAQLLSAHQSKSRGDASQVQRDTALFPDTWEDNSQRVVGSAVHSETAFALIAQKLRVSSTRASFDVESYCSSLGLLVSVVHSEANVLVWKIHF